MINTGSLQRLRLGDHLCVLVDDDHAHREYVLAYIRAGLQHNHQVLYLTDATTTTAAQVTARGGDTAEALAAGRLRISTAPPGGDHREPEAAVAELRRHCAQAGEAGYRGLRVIDDVSWAEHTAAGIERLCAYEAHANRVLADGLAMAVCLYDTRRFSRTALQKISWAHPATATQETDPGLVPQLRAVRTTSPPGIRLSGEVDLSNRHALQTLLEHLLDDTSDADGPVTVDITQLRFADSAATRILIRTASSHVGRVRITGCSLPIMRLLKFNGADALPGLVENQP